MKLPQKILKLGLLVLIMSSFWAFSHTALADESFVNITQGLTFSNPSVGNICGWYPDVYDGSRIFGTAMYLNKYPETTNLIVNNGSQHVNSIMSDCNNTPQPRLEGGFLNGAASTPDGTYWVKMTSTGIPFVPDWINSTSYYFEAVRSNGLWSIIGLPTCSDGIQNQDETGIDTGGVCDVSARNPVLIVPGVLGTDIIKDDEKLWLDLVHNLTDIGDQFMDPLQFDDSLLPLDTGLTTGNVIKKETANILGFKPILFDYTASLLEEFENQGYVEGTDLFLFPYDWRYGVSNDINNQLQQKIQDIRTQTGSEEVDVIAHSTGGLLVKKYVMDHQSDNYIDKAIFVGVPNTGSPKAIKVLLQGDSFDVPFLADEEMKKIAKNLPVVYDLSPSEQYFNNKGSYIKVIDQGLLNSSSQDLNFDQANSFLINDHNLNDQALSEAHNLHTQAFDNFDMRNSGVDLYSINGCKAGTISKVIERRVQGLLFNTVEYDRPEESPGDGTVPLESATNLPIDQDHKYYAFSANHGKMLSQDGTRQQIVNLISGSSLDTGNIITQDISNCKLNGKVISIYSPLDINITDQDGNHSGLVSGGIENNIPNADFEIMGEHKFVYIPTDEGQTYTVSLQGTGNGTFTLESTDVVDNGVTQTETFSEIPVTTNLKGDLNIEDSLLSLDTNGDHTTDIELQGAPGKIVTMPYIFSGFLQPVNDTKYHSEQAPSVFKSGSTIPIKFQLKKHDGTIVQAGTAPTWLAPQKGSSMSLPVGESVYTGTATSGTIFKWDPVSQQYVYNWSAKGLTPGYWYKISVKLDDGNTYSVTVGLR